MDLFNKYFMRSTGEKKFQPVTQAEKVAFAAFDIAKEKGWIKGLTEPELVELMNELHEQFQRTLQN